MVTGCFHFATMAVHPGVWVIIISQVFTTNAMLCCSCVSVLPFYGTSVYREFRTKLACQMRHKDKWGWFGWSGHVRACRGCVIFSILLLALLFVPWHTCNDYFLCILWVVSWKVIPKIRVYSLRAWIRIKLSGHYPVQQKQTTHSFEEFAGRAV